MKRAAVVLVLLACDQPSPRPSLDYRPAPKQLDAADLPSPRSCPPGTTCTWLPKPKPYSAEAFETHYPKSLEALRDELKAAQERMDNR